MSLSSGYGNDAPAPVKDAVIGVTVGVGVGFTDVVGVGEVEVVGVGVLDVVGVGVEEVLCVGVAVGCGVDSAGCER